MKQFSSSPHGLLSFFLPAVFGLSLVLSGRAAQFSITTNNTKNLALSAAFDGTNYLVAIQGDNLFNRANTNRQVAVQLVSQSGTLAGPLIDIGRNSRHELPSVAFDGTNYLVVWSDNANSPNDDAYGQFISTGGALVGSAFPISQAPNDQSPHGIVFDGTNYFVMWDDRRRGAAASGGSAPYDVYGQRVSMSGVLVGGEIRISPADDTRDYENSRLAFDGTNYFAVWTESSLSGSTGQTDVRAQFVNPNGTLVGSVITIKADGVQINNPPSPGIGFDGTNYLVSWHQDISSTEHSLLGQRLSRAGSLVGGVISISTSPANSSLPSIAFDGVNYLVTWSDSFGSTNQTCKARFIDPAGNHVSSEFAPFASQGTNAPVVARPIFDGKRYLVIGTLGLLGINGDIYGTFISPLPRGAFPIAITSSNEVSLSVAFDGTNYLAGIGGSPKAHDEVTAQLFSPAGALIGSRITTGRFGGSPYVAFDGTNYLLVWGDVANSTNSFIYGQFISRAGLLVRTPFAISVAHSGSRSLDAFNPIVFDGTNYLVVWYDERNGSNSEDIYGQLVTPAGTLFGSEIPIATDPESQRKASTAFDGTNYLVVWQSRRAGSLELHDTYGKLLSKAGVPGSAFLISQNPSADHFPTSVAFDGANYLVAWTRDIGPGFPSPDEGDIYARLVTRTGSFVGNEFPITTAPGSQPFGFVSYDGANYLVSWLDNPTASIRHRFFNRSGLPITAEFSLFGSQGTRFPLGGFFFDGSKLVALVSFVDSNFSNGDVYGLILPRHRVDLAGPIANGQVPLRFTGMPGVTYAIQGTSNLLSAGTVWTTLATSNSLSGTFNFTPTNAPGSSRRFYRALLP